VSSAVPCCKKVDEYFPVGVALVSPLQISIMVLVLYISKLKTMEF